MDITNYLIESKSNNEFITKIHYLVSNNKINLLEFTYLKEFDNQKGSLINSQWVADLCNNINDDEFNDIIVKLYSKIFKKKSKKIIVSIKGLITEITKINFTNDQKTAIKMIFKFLSNKDGKVFSLWGYAGTGKTFTMSEIVFFLLRNKLIKSVALTAPTHNAVSILQKKFMTHIQELYEEVTKKKITNDTDCNEIFDMLKEHGIKIWFTTIHALLGFKSEFTHDGNKYFTRKSNDIFDTESSGNLLDYELVILDECSMIPTNIYDTLFFELNKHIQKSDSTYKKIPKIIFGGDVAQLPCVNENITLLFHIDIKKNFTFNTYKKLINIDNDTNIDNISLLQRYNKLVYDIDNMEKIILKEIVRSKIKNVSDICYQFRLWAIGEIKMPNLKSFMNVDGVKLYKYDRKIKKTDTLWFKKYLEDLKKGMNSNIIITWTNKQSDEYNNKVRLELFGKSADIYEIGDILKLKDFYMVETDNPDDIVNFYTSQLIKIVDINRKNISIEGFKTKLNSKAAELKNSNYFENKFKPIINEINKNTIRKYKVWELLVNIISSENEINSDNIYKIYVIDESSKKQLELDKKIASDFISKLRGQLMIGMKNKSKQIDDNIIIPLRKECDKIFVSKFANVVASYSGTTHTMQGQNCYNVYVDADDILKNTRMEEATKCLYTAVSRTSNELFILI
jgi:hypothetical protein